jgi:hypothetical protein
MAARGFVVCRAAGGLSPTRWRRERPATRAALINEPLLTSLLYKIRKGHSEVPEWPLTCVGTAGFEPTTP